ncbi:hypothetical protein GCM10010402_56540 [Actinomadura luteofluorescens]|uniref:hypothetical protein n=1 Tax=Actinomadura luteofluorescens TaxID=46163 RepID=UPI002164DE37|nr:hypothetical protein [Actinomadura glauciflava]MCR3737567.1 hypothetical protein [Actinomadura glauciflava]
MDLDRPFSSEMENALVDLIAKLEPGLGRAAVIEAIVSTFGRPGARRRAAAAIVAKPDLLTSGRPDGPIAVDHLLRALLARGAGTMVLPSCPLCGKANELDQHADGTRVCRPCTAKRRRRRAGCSSCGMRNVVYQDRAGQLFCPKHRPGMDIDPVEEIVALVAPLAHGVDQDVLRTTIGTLAKHRFALVRLFWEIDERPDLLSGQAHHGSAILVRLVDALVELRAPGVVAPACPGCGLVRPLAHARDGERFCRPCYRSMESQATCAECERSRAVAGRTLDGQPLCATCHGKRPENHTTCAHCGEPGLVAHRTPEGPVCRRCARMGEANCALCGRHGLCDNIRKIGMPRCLSCIKARHPCLRCTRTRQPVARTPDGYLCSDCWTKDPTPFKTCSGCGVVEELFHEALCPRCACGRLADTVLADTSGTVRPELHALRGAWVTSPDPRTIIQWLRSDTAGGRLLKAIAQREVPLSHPTLDELSPDRSVEHLRAMLVHTGILPARDERLAHLNRWIEAKIDELGDPEDRHLLRLFSTWNQLERLRRKVRGQPITDTQADYVQANVTAAAQLLTWLRAHGLTLDRCTQHELDLWLESATSTQANARNFVIWACASKHAKNLEIPVRVRQSSTAPLAEQDRWSLVRKLLTDDSTRLADRVAGLLVLLFAQPMATIAALQTGQILHKDDRVALLLGQEPLELPDQVGILVLELAANRRVHSMTGRDQPTPWLFPGRNGERHVTRQQLAKNLRKLGIYSQPSRNAALLDLASELPAAVLARLLGMSVRNASKWQRRQGDWTSYAAEISQR